jgi:hypothetical protein
MLISLLETYLSNFEIIDFIILDLFGALKAPSCFFLRNRGTL